MDKSIFIGFPPSFLGDNARRLEVLYDDKGVLVLSKPVGVVIDAHPWFEGVPSIVKGLRKQVDEGKVELEGYHFKDVYSVYAIEPEVTGVALIAKNKEAMVFLRNAFGSSNINFKFLLLAEAGEGEDERVCDLPLAIHFNQTRMLVSHKTGKKCKTSFKRIERLGLYDLWEASVDFFRMHQVRLHALECGIRIVGERVYDHVAPVYYSKIKKGSVPREEEEKPLSEGLCVHLDEVTWWAGDQEKSIKAPLTKAWDVVLTKLRDVTQVD